LAAARLRLAYDELLASQLALQLMRSKMKRDRGTSRVGDGTRVARVRAVLPTLTNGQEQALDEIRRDLASPERMLRLVQGDVGSGKTIVAFLAMTSAVEAGYQAALMAPTEILARQHFERLPLAEAAGMTIALHGRRERCDAQIHPERICRGYDPDRNRYACAFRRRRIFETRPRRD